MKVIEFPKKETNNMVYRYLCTNCKGGVFRLEYDSADDTTPALVCCVCDEFAVRVQQAGVKDA